MKRSHLRYAAFPWVLGSMALATDAHAAELTPPRIETAQTLLETAPTLDTLHDFLAEAPETDPEDRIEQAQERDGKIAVLEAAIEEKATSTVPRSRALYELAQEHLARADFLRDQAMTKYAKDYDRYFIGEQLEAPKPELQDVKEELLKGLSTLRDMLANDPKNPRKDELNFLIAMTLARVGNDHCEAYFKQAIQHSKSKEWATLAKIGRADYLVQKGRNDEALKLYEEARKASGKNAKVKAYANYRLGWVHLTRDWGSGDARRKEALAKAEQALKFTVQTLEDGDEASRYVLHREAARDLAWIWAITGNEKEPARFLEDQDLEDLQPYNRDRVAVEAIRSHNLDKAASVYKELALADPEDPMIPDYRLRLGQAYAMEGDTKSMQREIAALKDMTTNEDNEWFDEHEDDEGRIARAKRMIALLPASSGFKLIRVAQEEKDPARKKKQLETAVHELAARAKANPKDPEIVSIRMTLVQALSALGRPMDVLDQLDEIVKLGKQAEEFQAAAITERLNLAIKLEADQTYPPVPALGEVRAPIPLPSMKKRFAVYATDFLKLNPEVKEKPALLYQMANDLFVYGHYTEALPRFEVLVNEFPTTDQAKAAIEIVLSMGVKRGDWDELIRLSTSFLNNRAVKGKALRDYVKENLDYAKGQKLQGS